MPRGGIAGRISNGGKEGTREKWRGVAGKVSKKCGISQAGRASCRCLFVLQIFRVMLSDIVAHCRRWPIWDRARCRCVRRCVRRGPCVVVSRVALCRVAWRGVLCVACCGPSCFRTASDVPRVACARGMLAGSCGAGAAPDVVYGNIFIHCQIWEKICRQKTANLAKISKRYITRLKKQADIAHYRPKQSIQYIVYNNVLNYNI